jgi:uracil-DNA glycosylase family 4
MSPPMKKKILLSSLGITEILSDTPVNRLENLETSSINTPKKESTESQTLEGLKKELDSFEGCALKKTAMNLVFSDGNPQADIMLIGEAPGADEDRQGKPFVGMSGQLLTKAFKAAGFDREKDLYISNTVFWRPPGNRQPTSQELESCLPFTQRHIALIQPKLLILVGGTAVKALLNTNEGITKLRGKWFDYEIPGLEKPIKTTAIYHPAYLLRSPGRKKDMWMDLLKIKKELRA